MKAHPIQNIAGTLALIFSACSNHLIMAQQQPQPRSAPVESHWAFLPLRDVHVSSSESQIITPPYRRSICNKIDVFINNRLLEQSIQPSPRADRVTLIKRLSLDLTGLLPDWSNVERFVEDESPDAYESLVDRLLSSPQYGEKWAQHWLDLCHYADTDGYLTDQERPVAWRYREWLINALNDDMPFDQFTIEQLAGDLLPGSSVEQQIATGFLRNTLSNREGGADLEEYRVEQIVDRVQMVGTTWLGLTIGCARCHDHKYDPLTQREFYQLYAFFNNADEININAPLPGEKEQHDKVISAYQAARQKLIAPIKKELELLQLKWEEKLLHAYRFPGEDHVWDRHWEVLGLIWGGRLGEGQLEGTEIVKISPPRRTEAQKARLLDYFLKRGFSDPKWAELNLSQLSQKLSALAKTLPPLTRAPTMQRTQTNRDSYIHERGSFRDHGARVVPAVPSFLPPAPVSNEPHRLQYARWLTDQARSLTARVTVNRAWQELFGIGLVATSDDFGIQGERPSHPELLDWLGLELIRNQWSMKRIHRLIVTSHTYQRASTFRTDLIEVDPDNRLRARQSSLRLTSNQVRDNYLLASQLLVHRVGGPSVMPPQPDSVAQEGFENSWKISDGADRYRRGLYTWLQRLSPFAQNVTFDAPSLSLSCSKRVRSNTSLQALTLLNDPVFHEAAQNLARQVLEEHPDSDSRRMQTAFAMSLSRYPNQPELDQLLEFLNQQRQMHRVVESDSNELTSWTHVTSVLLNLHEFITRD